MTRAEIDRLRAALRAGYPDEPGLQCLAVNALDELLDIADAALRQHEARRACEHKAEAEMKKSEREETDNASLIEQQAQVVVDVYRESTNRHSRAMQGPLVIAILALERALKKKRHTP